MRNLFGEARAYAAIGPLCSNHRSGHGSGTCAHASDYGLISGYASAYSTGTEAAAVGVP